MVTRDARGDQPRRRALDARGRLGYPGPVEPREEPATPPAALHIDDLARPRLPWPLRAANILGAPLARRISLAEADLRGEARRRAGLDDFGPPGFREPLRVLLAALEREARLTPLGRLMARELVLGLLATRLRLAALLAEHPEIRDEPIEAPIVILGLPRTGTTHLHNLLAGLPTLRSLPYWESLEPIPPPEVRAGHAPDRRRRRCEQALRFQHWVMPLFPAMHEMAADARHEEIQLLAVAFESMLFESSYRVPSYGRWYQTHDQTEAYAYLKLLLQALQWLDGEAARHRGEPGGPRRRWLLKSPQHLEQLRVLFAVFPDAWVVQTHRDPVRVTASTCTMLAYALRMQARDVDLAAHGRYWAARIEAMLRASLEDRPAVPAERILDVRFDHYMADEIATALRVCAFAGLPADAPARGRLEAYQRSHPRGRHGAIDYRLEDFGLDPAERRAALRFYPEAFGVPEEGDTPAPARVAIK